MGWNAWRPLFLVVAGWGITLLPWIVYVGQDVPAYQGQMLRHESRFDLLNPTFYFNNLLHEPWRYVKFFGRFRPPILWSRPGFWLMIVSLVAAYAHLWPQIRQRPTLANRFLFITLPVLAFLLAVLVNYKRFTYVALLLPFLAIQVGLGIVLIWDWAQRRGKGWQVVYLVWLLTAVIAGIYSTANILQTARATTPYQELTNALKQDIQPRSRILMIHDYWLGLAEYDVYSLDLAYNLSNPSFVGAAARPLPQIVQDLAPAYIIVPQHLLKLYLMPEMHPSEKVAHFWQSLDSIIHENCSETVTQIQNQTYGDVSVYRCAWPQNAQEEP
jgi:MFS family permease